MTNNLVSILLFLINKKFKLKVIKSFNLQHKNLLLYNSRVDLKLFIEKKTVCIICYLNNFVHLISMIVSIKLT